MEEITKDMTIGDVLNKYPETAEVLFEAGIHCVGCPMAGHETIEQGLHVHGLDEKQIEEVVKKLNEKITKK